MRNQWILLAFLCACDPGAPSVIEVRAPEDTRNAAGPYRVTVVTRGAVDAVVVRWTDARDASAALETRSPLGDDGGGRWSGDLPGRPAGSDVRLAVVAEGPGGDARWPSRGEHRFRVLGGDGACLVDGDCLRDEVCDRLENRCHVPPERCADDGDCPQDYVCARENGTCRFRPVPCADDAQCGAGHVCAGGFCAPAAECDEDRDCPAGARCLDPPGRCAGADACVRDGDCPADRPRCDAGRCRATGPGCDPPCDPGAVCVDGACVAGCDPACAPGTMCVDGACVAGCDPACAPGTMCVEGACVPGCDPACAPGTMCVDGACVPEACEPLCGPREQCVEGRCVSEHCNPACGRGEVCVGGRCVPDGCDPDCDAGAVCVDGRCVPGECDPPCGPDEVCRDGMCVCDCAPDERCEAGACVPACDPPCDAGERCLEGRCVGPCDPACGPGLVCRDGRCLPPPACANGCPDGMHCRRGAGVCVECTADGHCPAGAHCNAEFNCALGDRGAPCVPCGRGRTCGAGFTCRADQFDVCLPRCGPRGRCPPGFVCDGDACLPDLFCRGAECVRDGDCESGVCMGGVCEAPQQCDDDGDCRDRRCVDGRCVPRAPACGEGCAAGTLCVGGRCVPGEPVGACAPCGEAADCDSPAFCGDPFGTGQRQCHAICGGDCPGDLRCTAFSDATAVCVSADEGVCPRPPACREDDLEDNDDQRTATRLGGGADVRGVACAGDPDVFLLQPRRGTRGTVSIEARGRLRYRLTGPEGGLRREGETEGATRLEVDGGGAWLTLTANGQASYRLTTDFRSSRGCANDGLEPNDTAETAVRVVPPIDFGGMVLCGGDRDHVRFPHDGMGTVVRIEFVHAAGDIDAELLDAEGRSIANSTSNGDVERFDLGGDRPAGDYIVHVYPFALREGQSTTYRLVIGR